MMIMIMKWNALLIVQMQHCTALKNNKKWKKYFSQRASLNHMVQ